MKMVLLHTITTERKHDWTDSCLTDWLAEAVQYSGHRALHICRCVALTFPYGDIPSQKSKIYDTPVDSIEDLKRKILAEINRISQESLQNVSENPENTSKLHYAAQWGPYQNFLNLVETLRVNNFLSRKTSQKIIKFSLSMWIHF